MPRGEIRSPINRFNKLRGPVIDKDGSTFLKIGDQLDLIKQAIIRMIFTPKGTRMGNLEFGTSISDLSFTNNWENLERIIAYEISEGIARWEPRAEFIGIELIELDNTRVNFIVRFREIVTNSVDAVPVVAEFV